MIDTTKLGHGAFPDKVDERDFQAAPYIAAAAPINWNVGSGLPRPPLNTQNGSSSCVAQAFSYYHWQLHGKDYSRRDLYARIHLLGGGAYIRDGGLAIVNQGQATRDEVPDPVPEMENQMEVGEGTPEQEADDKELNSFTVPNDIDSVATAINEYKGVVLGVNGSWVEWGGTLDTLTNPEPPVQVAWSHALYAVDFHIHSDGQKCIICVTSWSDVIDQQTGQQLGLKEHHIRANYFSSGNTLNPWTLIAKEQQIMSNAIFVQKGDTAEFGYYLPAMSEDALKDKAKNLGLNILNADASIDYSKAVKIQGL